MMKKIIYICTLLFSVLTSAQELNAVVTVNTQQVNLSNRNVFKTLEKSLHEFINNTTWTSIKTHDNERIRCNFTFVITKYENNQMEGSLLVQSSRPVFNTAYQSPVVNLQDKDVSFSYQEFETLSFTNNSFESNLTSIVAYYAYLILGFDANTFVESGGHPYFVQAQSVVTNAQSSGYAGWTDNGDNNRWMLIKELLSENYTNYHKIWYTYHRLGLDIMNMDEKNAKEEMQNALLQIEKIPSLRLNSYAVNILFGAKTDEIVSIYSGGSMFSTKTLKESLLKVAPSQAIKWNMIK